MFLTPDASAGGFLSHQAPISAPSINATSPSRSGRTEDWRDLLPACTGSRFKRDPGRSRSQTDPGSDQEAEQEVSCVTISVAKVPEFQSD